MILESWKIYEIFSTGPKNFLMRKIRVMTLLWLGLKVVCSISNFSLFKVDFSWSGDTFSHERKNLEPLPRSLKSCPCLLLRLPLNTCILLFECFLSSSLLLSICYASDMMLPGMVGGGGVEAPPHRHLFLHWQLHFSKFICIASTFIIYTTIF